MEHKNQEYFKFINYINFEEYNEQEIEVGDLLLMKDGEILLVGDCSGLFGDNYALDRHRIEDIVYIGKNILKQLANLIK